MSASPRRKRARKHIALREQLAAALSMLLPQAQRDELRDAKVPAKRVIALFEFHHVIFHAIGGSDRWFNLTPMLAEAHRERSGQDTATVAKVRRLARAQQRFSTVMSGAEPPPARRKRTIASRPFEKGHRPLRSGNNLKRRDR
jgi:hypothetical protein